MPKKKKGKHYVIYAKPGRHGEGPNSYFDKDGKVTKMKDEAMSFVTFDNAQEGAKEHEIALDGPYSIQEEEYEYWVP